MSTIEIERTTPRLARFARACAVLAGVGASFGIGASLLSLGPKVASFASDNHLALSARMVLLRILFLAMLGLPAVVVVFVTMRVGDPHRLATFERVARWLAPVAPLGLWPLLLQERLWKGKTFLFLSATLACSLLVWAATRRLDEIRVWNSLREMVRFVGERIPSRMRGWGPILALLVIVSWVVYRGMQGDVVSGVRPARELSSLTWLGGLKRLGHGGILSLPFVLHPMGRAAAKLAALSSLVLVASAAIPIFMLCRRRFGVPSAFIVALAYLSLPQHLLVASGTELSLGAAAVFFFWAVHAWERKRPVAFVLATLLMLAIHEQTATWLVCLGIHLAYRERNAKGAIWLASFGAAYFAVLAFVVLPRLGVDTYDAKFRSLLLNESPGLTAFFGTLVTNPAHVLLRFCGQTELEFWLILFVPLSLLPLRSPHWLLWLSPFPRLRGARHGELSRCAPQSFECRTLRRARFHGGPCRTRVATLRAARAIALSWRTLDVGVCSRSFDLSPRDTLARTALEDRGESKPSVLAANQ
ncbi:MAG: DUF2079 domain-containing protein [Polyangiaceae bacterium]